jgi:flavorubredoxin
VGERSASVAEIASGIYRIATYHEPWRSSINQYLIAGAEPALISTGLRERFADTWAGIAQVIDPSSLRHLVVLHFESDECGALNEFLTRAPRATPLASMRASLASLADFAVRPPRGLGDGEVISTGEHDLQVIEAPYVHAWDGIIVADERAQVVFSADLFIQPGMSDPLTRDDRSALSLQLYRTFYGMPPEPYLQRVLDRIDAVGPAILAPGHGSAIAGNLVPYFRVLRTAGGGAFARPVSEAQQAAR